MKQERLVLEAIHTVAELDQLELPNWADKEDTGWLRYVDTQEHKELARISRLSDQSKRWRIWNHAGWLFFAHRESWRG